MKDEGVNAKRRVVRSQITADECAVYVNSTIAVIIPSSVHLELRNHLPIALPKQRSVCESRKTKVTFLYFILHFVKEEDAKTIQPGGHHRLVQQSFLSSLH